MIKICPHCHQRYMVDEHSGDYVHQCNSKNNTLDKEDVVVIGSWSDYSGSKNVSKNKVMFQGAANKVFGELSDIEGKDIDNLTLRGNRSSTHRTRQHLEYINN